MSWVPAWEPWPVRLCAYRGCPNPRYTETISRPGGLKTLVRRWCHRHCSVRATVTVQHPAEVIRLPRPGGPRAPAKL